MKSVKPAVVVLFLLGLVFSAAAAPNVVIDAVQVPVWVERDGRRLPAAPGMELRNRDVVRTGDQARVVLSLGEGSTFKLGENAQMSVNALNQTPGRLFTAALDVSQGSFRLTTGEAGKSRARAINVRAGVVTASLRGTDLWGRSEPARDYICLLEGRIIGSHPQGAGVELSEPLQFYSAERNQAPDPVGFIDRENMLGLMATTELRADAAALRRSGAWAVRLGALDSEEQALELYDRARAAGYTVRVVPHRQKGGAGYRYEVLVGPLAGENEASALASHLAQTLDAEAPLAVRRQAAFRPR